MTSRRRMEDSEYWQAVGRIEGQSIPDVARFVGVHHSTIMETILNKPNSRLMTWSRSCKSYDPRKYSKIDLYPCVVVIY
ncbi:uncharacterized protein TNCV_2289231 [Trichonephila clavipes]|uniref:Uncharacterized protein n=1 Tax=Trichonephila clavipes TaxID=2585209 RepID=A0A8X6V697_TRICX|nr:uncharacterized protein TNCV_2289231 [Trichonephila clavipes]